MKIAVFGGSFDPVHKEHINLVKSAIVSLALDKLFVMPACQPPHKKNKALLADKDRLALCRLAFSDNENISHSHIGNSHLAIISLPRPARIFASDRTFALGRKCDTDRRVGCDGTV